MVGVLADLALTPALPAPPGAAGCPDSVFREMYMWGRNVCRGYAPHTHISPPHIHLGWRASRVNRSWGGVDWCGLGACEV